MTINNINIFAYLKRDMLAGTITGVMAVPLTIGICLLSDYPVMTGLYTVIFACIVGFISYLVRPGNYVGTPGVAAGLAPALALGVSSFGMENMPFVIFITATFQAIVWKFQLERYLLRLVPHYLVEGLLAGVGLKIGLKFIPFLYDIEHETDVWLNFEREVVIILSVVSFALFVLLFKYYKKRMPALPYIIIMASSFVLSFFMPLPMVSIDAVPFKLQLPLPNLASDEFVNMLPKMIGFALMLGTIDIIEQVMSNVAIEKLDPLNRKCNTNNSLMAIWIANIGATFFGGMTNLDGLAKSTTNAVAGAVTKLSNLFTAIVLLGVVAYPNVLAHMPEYALGIIMVYSGWKMIANIAHVRAEGRYALILAGICGFLVFELGIFEGLILVMAGHAIIQFIFMRRLGKSTQEIIHQFKSSFAAHNQGEKLEMIDARREPMYPVLEKWVESINNRDSNQLSELYNSDSVLIPSLSSEVRTNRDQIMSYYGNLLQKDRLKIQLGQINLIKANGSKIENGDCTISWQEGGFENTYKTRFSVIIKNGKILAHHMSQTPSRVIDNEEKKSMDYVG